MPGADAWSAPRTIAEGEDWFVNWADFPSLAVGEDGRLIAHWLVRTGGQPYAYGVVVSHSTDGGRTWSQPKRLHEDETPTEHGFVSLLPMHRGEWLAVWLDGRRFATGKQEMTLRARLLKLDGTWGPEMLVDDLVCDCCQTSAVRLAEDRALIVYRDRSPREVRDIFIVRYEGGMWSAPRPVHVDGWRIPACPVNGPSIDARGARVVVAWFTAADGERRVEMAFSSDGGQTFAPPIRIDRGAPLGRVDTVMLDDGSALVSWMEAEEKGNEAGLFIRRVARDGGQSEPVRVVGLASSRASGFPRLARWGSQMVIAWTEVGERSRVRTALATWQ
ncbi:MAG: exo-alpha-sialidase [Acidobacteria bacterium]|nr:MAG: exo-alpha-sialidase [Acidobacteriota bacterium]